jgi:hypothetical protein
VNGYEKGSPQSPTPETKSPPVSLLGLPLYELPTLHPAHDGRDRADLLHQMAFGEPKAPRTHNACIPRDLVRCQGRILTVTPLAV